MNYLTNLKSEILNLKITPAESTTGGEFDPARTNGLSLNLLVKDKPRLNGLNPLPRWLCLAVLFTQMRVRNFFNYMKRKELKKAIKYNRRRYSCGCCD